MGKAVDYIALSIPIFFSPHRNGIGCEQIEKNQALPV